MIEFGIQNHFLGSLLCTAIGVTLGVVFFSGLLLTVDRLEQTNHPVRLMLTSLLLRFALALGVFYLLARTGHWQYLLLATAGFVAARMAIIYRSRLKTAAGVTAVRRAPTRQLDQTRPETDK